MSEDIKLTLRKFQPTEEEREKIKKELEEIKKKFGFDKLDELDKKLGHEPVKLSCLGCGKTISEKFTGGLWSYTCSCGSRVLGSERGVMLPSSLIAGYKTFNSCKECKSEEEHIHKNIEGLLGKNYNKELDDEDLQKLKLEAIETIKKYSKNKDDTNEK